MKAKYYEEIRNDLNTGDLVLFSGKGFVSRMIKRFTRSKWSHVGMVINSVEWDMKLLWESTTLSKIKDITTGTTKQGVQLVPLSEKIKNYDGEVGIRTLNTNVSPDEIRDTLRKLRKELKGRDYEQDKLELFKSAYDWWGGKNEEDLSSIFCSELMAEAYQRLGFFSEDSPSNEYTPEDFAKIIELNRQSNLNPLLELV